MCKKVFRKGVVFWWFLVIFFQFLVVFPVFSAPKMRHETFNGGIETGFETVGPKADRVVLPINQVLTPAGLQVKLAGMRPQVVCLSPDGKIVVTSGKTAELVVISPISGKILQRVPLPGEGGAAGDNAQAVSSHILKPDKSGQVSYTGLVFSPDGSRIYFSNVNGSVKVFGVDKGANVDIVKPLYSISLPGSGVRGHSRALPAGLAVSGDGQRLYVALNVSNRLLELNLRTHKPERMFDVGVAPYAVVLARGKAYVSNWGGPRPSAGSTTGPIGETGKVQVDNVRFIANKGSVSVINLARGVVQKEIATHMHSSGMVATPDGRYIFLANASSDNVSVIDTSTDKVVDDISLNWKKGDLFGATPNALVFDYKHNLLYVCNGTQNAVAVVQVLFTLPGQGHSYRVGYSRLLGLIPTGWFPGAVAWDRERNMLYVANIKGIGSWREFSAGQKIKRNSRQYFGSLSIIKAPVLNEVGRGKLSDYTRAVLRNNHKALAKAALLPPRVGVKARPVPQRSGEPSVFKHVIYIIKENRTYDQVLGDMKRGNGDASLCVFGRKVTPNQHKMAREFVLLDNTCCSGILSADGHQWADTGITTDYMEKSFAGFPRSYPDGMEPHDVDALAYSPAGFLWDNAIAHNVSLRDYGEFTFGYVKWKNGKHRRGPGFLDIYNDFVNHTGLISISSKEAIGSLKPYIDRKTIGWNLDVPDIYRAAEFIRELRQFERNGKFPALIIICLPNDHTSGTGRGHPTPAAQVADNDLAMGRIVEAVSHSVYWKDTCIFAIEDDPQAGWDHVSSFRTTAYVVSAYTKRSVVVSNRYDQPGLLRTIELILGMKPMNQIDACSVPWRACFTKTPDFRPYNAVPNIVPLNQMNPAPEAIADPVQRHYALVSASFDLDEPDQCPEDVFNHIIWNAQKGSKVPYPQWAISEEESSDD